MEIRTLSREIQNHIKSHKSISSLQYCRQNVIDVWYSLTPQEVSKYTTTTDKALISTIYSINYTLICYDKIVSEYNDAPIQEKRNLSEAFEILWNVNQNVINIQQEIGFDLPIGKSEFMNVLKLKSELQSDQKQFIAQLQNACSSFLCGNSYLFKEDEYHLLFIPKLIDNWVKFDFCLALFYENLMLHAYQDKMTQQYNLTIKELIKEINDINQEAPTKSKKQKQNKSKAQRNRAKKAKFFKQNAAAKKIQKIFRLYRSRPIITLDKMNIKRFAITYSSDIETCLEEEEESLFPECSDCSSCDETEKVIEQQYKRADTILQDHAQRWEFMEQMRRLCLMPVVNTYYQQSQEIKDFCTYPIIKSYYGEHFGGAYYYPPEVMLHEWENSNVGI